MDEFLFIYLIFQNGLIFIDDWLFTNIFIIFGDDNQKYMITSVWQLISSVILL